MVIEAFLCLSFLNFLIGSFRCRYNQGLHAAFMLELLVTESIKLNSLHRFGFYCLLIKVYILTHIFIELDVFYSVAL